MIVAGFGFRTSATAQSLLGALRTCENYHEINVLATFEDKAESAVFQEVSAQLNLPILKITAEDAQAHETPSQSKAVQAARGVGSVCEACVLAAGATLLRTRVYSPDRLASCAIGEIV